MVVVGAVEWSGDCDKMKNDAPFQGFPDSSVGKESTWNIGDTEDTGSISGGFPPPSPGGGKWQPAPVFLPENSHRQRSLASYNPKGRKELD